jgi:hypothetical protein
MRRGLDTESMIARYLGLTRNAERALADAFVLVAFRHAADPEMRNAARLYSNWCTAHLEALRPAVEHYGVARSVAGERLRRALFRGRRVDGFGLVRDLHDLITLATSVHSCWSALSQGARQQRDRSLEHVSRTCDAETLRQIAWLETKMRQSAPQALAVPGNTGRELAASIPHRWALGTIADLVPGPALRGLLPLAPVAGAMMLLLAVILGTGSDPQRAAR